MSRQLDGTGLKRLHRDWRRRTVRRLALVLDDVRTPVNVGSIVRSAAAYGVEDVWACGITPDPSTGGAAKVAMGTERYVRWQRADSAVAALGAARARGYLAVALELTDDAEPLWDAAPPAADVCLVVGHEDHGLTRATLAACDRRAYLPLVGRVGSLNVAVAAAVALAELRRAEWLAPPLVPVERAGTADPDAAS